MTINFYSNFILTSIEKDVNNKSYMQDNNIFTLDSIFIPLESIKNYLNYW